MAAVVGSRLSGDRFNGEVVKSNDTYTVIDYTELKSLVISQTTLFVGKNTTGHSHIGQEEVYFFTQGDGSLILDGLEFFVSAGDVWAIPDGAHHKVCNTGEDTMVFQCVFNGERKK
tara:strand:- start:105 stop:452 length:348 start_codon:yes stop_codon:yes gene_type:complete